MELEDRKHSLFQMRLFGNLRRAEHGLSRSLGVLSLFRRETSGLGREAQLEHRSSRCIGDIHVPLFTIPELVVQNLSPSSRRMAPAVRIASARTCLSPGNSVMVDDVAAVNDMEEIAGHGALLGR
jgi:hypothetical protein